MGGLDLGHDVVEVIQRLHHRAQRPVGDPPGRAGHDLESLLVALGRIEGDLCSDDDDRRLRTMLRAQPEIPLPAGHDEADVAVLEFVATDCFEQRFRHRGTIKRDHHVDGGSRLIESLDVLLETEDLATVKTNSLEDPVPVEKAVIEHRNLCLGLGIKSAVDIDLHRPCSMRV